MFSRLSARNNMWKFPIKPHHKNHVIIKPAQRLQAFLTIMQTAIFNSEHWRIKYRLAIA